jgi:hypothetical protein
MLSNVAIKTAINDLLADATGLKIYGKEVVEGYETPSLFTEKVSKPFQHETQNFAKSGFTIKITYFQSTPDELEQMRLLDTVREAFGMTVKVEDRTLTVGEITHEFVGQKEDILQISVDFDFYENTTPGESAEIAEEYDVTLTKSEEA